MSPRARSSLILASAALWYALLLVLFSLRTEVSHTYFHTIRSAQISLPWLTRKVALPILGGTAAQGEGRLLFALVWSALFAFPLASLWWSLAAKEDTQLVRWGLLMSLYVPLVALAVLVVAYGLWLPHALLMGRM